jgi:hypothetical protein
VCSRDGWNSLTEAAHRGELGTNRPFNGRFGYDAPGVIRSCDDLVLGLYNALCIALRRDVPETDIVGQLAEEWDTVSDEYRDSGYGKAADQACAKEPLNRDTAIDVHMASTTDG